MDRDERLALLRDATVQLTDLAAVATGEELVPSCPGWTMHDLVVHVGSIHRWSAAILLSGLRTVPEPRPQVTGKLADWYAGCADALVAAIRAVEPDEPTPNFSRVRQTASFWLTRQLHETTIHVVDAAQALHRPEPWGVTDEVAADGIDEVLGIFFTRMTAVGRRPDVRARVRLDPIDRFESWITAPGSDPAGPPVQLHGNASAETAVRGTTAELYLALWNRIPADRLSFDSVEARAVFDGPRTP